MKNVIITGSASGMGRATAEYLLKNGYRVFGLDINKTQEIENFEQILCDVSDIESVNNAYNIVKQKVDYVDAIINFAGIIMMNSLVEIPEEDFVKIFNVNVFGAVCLFRVTCVFKAHVTGHYANGTFAAHLSYFIYLNVVAGRDIQGRVLCV